MYIIFLLGGFGSDLNQFFLFFCFYQVYSTLYILHSTHRRKIYMHIHFETIMWLVSIGAVRRVLSHKAPAFPRQDAQLSLSLRPVMNNNQPGCPPSNGKHLLIPAIQPL